jgi:hypothetical protein
MPGGAGQHFSISAFQHGGSAALSAFQLVSGRRVDDLFEEAVYEGVIRNRARAANRHQKAEMLKAKPEGRSELTSGGEAGAC